MNHERTVLSLKKSYMFAEKFIYQNNEYQSRIQVYQEIIAAKQKRWDDAENIITLVLTIPRRQLHVQS